MYEFINVEPIYTGGNIYVFLGELKHNYFMADSCCFDVRILDENPMKDETDPEYEEIWYAEWQEKHLVEDLDEFECKAFFKEMIKWIAEHESEGNYQLAEVEGLLEALNEIEIA